MRSSREVYEFWFVEHGQKDWYGADPAFDAALDKGFRKTHEAVARGEAFGWRTTAQGRLAEIIVLDQFSRQLHRGSAYAFAFDCMSLVLAQEAVALGMDQQVPDSERGFFYMPYMHSESLVIHDESLKLFGALSENLLEYERKHRSIIEQFGRFPKRNAALGRVSTPQEVAYIEQSGSSMF